MQVLDYAQDVHSVQETTQTFAGITEQLIKRINDQQSLNVFLSMNPNVIQEAQNIDQHNHEGMSLKGMTIAVKDNISTTGMPMTCGSKMLEHFRPMYDATVIERLKKNGAIILGKVNMDEFAMGSSGETSYFGPTDHPQFPGYVPGGSSSGSAVSVAAGLSHASLGSDTGGSVRQPAAFCGIYGFKPSYGRISRYGLTAFASSLDQIGIFSGDVATMALVFDAISGHDSHDSTTDPRPTAQSSELLKEPFDLQTLTLAILPEQDLMGLDNDVRRVYEELVKKLTALGVKFIHQAIPGSKAWIPTYYILATAEASSNLARFDGVRYGWRDSSSNDMTMASRSSGFGMEVKRRIMLGTYVLSSGYYEAYYVKAQKARRAIVQGYSSIFSKADALLLPTTAGLPFKRGEIKNPLEMYLSDYFTVSANIAGIPAISFPAGNSSEGLPIGMQLQTALMNDEVLLAITQAISSVH
ncbi:MAG: Asp-tRNA(Asn)/Glu-tRNA(Gln) amidotransferase subunit GatA [Ignavibacteria bacterium]|nr:Asp-tRNA(Asn)/Glu-tRNA(Gln) amidotransferase subunit GatA [Ignavibacteria bacterium]